MNPLMLLMAGAHTHSLINLSGGIVVGTNDFPQGFIFRSDGTVDEYDNGVVAQVNAGTDWIIPNTSAEDRHWIRMTNINWVFGSAFYDSAAAEDVWINMSSDRWWYVRDVDSGAVGLQEVHFDIEIGIGVDDVTEPTSAIAVGSYTIEHDWEI